MAATSAHERSTWDVTPDEVAEDAAAAGYAVAVNGPWRVTFEWDGRDAVRIGPWSGRILLTAGIVL
jgi:hypothetical protein